MAYETADGVYLSVLDVPGYGLLARQPLDSLRAGARVEADEEKRSPLDFVLWKKAKPGEPSWDVAVGRRAGPGWHTECVVMSLDLLGEGFDLHGGGQDLVFPHHENERAQAVADGKEFARHWMHNGWVTVGGEKMSKSLGNFTSLADLLDRSDARAYRLLVLRSHYRSPIEVTPETIAQAEAGLARLDELARRFALADPLADGPLTGAGAAAGDVDADAVAAFVAAMDDDLDTPGALATVFDLARRANAAADAGDDAGRGRGRPDGRAAGRRPRPPPRAARRTTRSTPRAADLVRRRDEARAARDWARADALRAELEAAGLAGRGRRRGHPDPSPVERPGRPAGDRRGHERRVNTPVPGRFSAVPRGATASVFCVGESPSAGGSRPVPSGSVGPGTGGSSLSTMQVKERGTPPWLPEQSSGSTPRRASASSPSRTGVPTCSCTTPPSR